MRDVERWGVSVVRITIDTREDSYQDALGVLRRAYGRHGPARKKDDSPTRSEDMEVSAGGMVEESVSRTASGAGGDDVPVRQRSAKGIRKSVARRTPATRAVAAASPGSKSTGKGAPGRKAVPSASSAQRRPRAVSKRTASGVAANTAPRGQSEKVRAWAQEHGMQVGSRGRMPANVIAAYLEANKD